MSSSRRIPRAATSLPPPAPPSAPPPLDDALAALAGRMLPLLDRGHTRLVEYIGTRHFVDHVHRDILLGTTTSMLVVTEEDFLANAADCLMHVHTYGRPLHVLCPDGHLCFCIEKRNVVW